VLESTDGDPFKIFAEEAEFRRETLKTIWPDLYRALARPSTGKPAWKCALAAHRDYQGRQLDTPPVVGRLWLNGPPACADCLARASARPGGYPLDRINPKDWTP
jgi:hypothetical protein